jgi:hypothetical protein
MGRPSSVRMSHSMGPDFPARPMARMHEACQRCAYPVRNPVDKFCHVMTGRRKARRSGQGRYIGTCHGPRRVADATMRPVTWHGPCIPVLICHNRAPDWHDACMRAPARAMHDPCHVASTQHASMHASCHDAVQHWHGMCHAWIVPAPSAWHSMRHAMPWHAPCMPRPMPWPCMRHAMPCRPMPGPEHGRP